MTAPVTNNDGAMPGGFLTISANGNSNGIVWASTPFNGDAVTTTVQGVLYAFNADTLQPLWSDKTNDSRDEVGYIRQVFAAHGGQWQGLRKHLRRERNEQWFRRPGGVWLAATYSDRQCGQRKHDGWFRRCPNSPEP